MQIFKVFNNNAVASITDDGQDVILTGAGIGFQKHTGDAVEENAIEKRYYFHDGESDSIYGLFAHTPVEFFNISKSIMDEAEKRLHIVLKDQVLIALTDHIVFAVPLLDQVGYERRRERVRAPLYDGSRQTNPSRGARVVRHDTT